MNSVRSLKFFGVLASTAILQSCGDATKINGPTSSAPVVSKPPVEAPVSAPNSTHSKNSSTTVPEKNPTSPGAPTSRPTSPAPMLPTPIRSSSPRVYSEDKVVPNSVMSFLSDAAAEPYVTRLYFSDPLQKDFVLLDLRNLQSFKYASGDDGLLFEGSRVEARPTSEDLYQTGLYSAKLTWSGTTAVPDLVAELPVVPQYLKTIAAQYSISFSKYGFVPESRILVYPISKDSTHFLIRSFEDAKTKLAEIVCELDCWNPQISVKNKLASFLFYDQRTSRLRLKVVNFSGGYADLSPLHPDADMIRARFLSDGTLVWLEINSDEVYLGFMRPTRVQQHMGLLLLSRDQGVLGTDIEEVSKGLLRIGVSTQTNANRPEVPKTGVLRLFDINLEISKLGAITDIPAIIPDASVSSLLDLIPFEFHFQGAKSIFGVFKNGQGTELYRFKLGEKKWRGLNVSNNVGLQIAEP